MRKGQKKRRFVLVGAIGIVLAAAVSLTLFALSDQITLFKTPTNIAEEGLEPGVRVRIGGLVKENSWTKENDGTQHHFLVTDTANDVHVVYTGIVPDLFREGQGVVLEGRRDDTGQFVADTVLAKHDENYVPKEVAEALKAQGVWKPGDPPPSSAVSTSAPAY